MRRDPASPPALAAVFLLAAVLVAACKPPRHGPLSPWDPAKARRVERELSERLRRHPGDAGARLARGFVRLTALGAHGPGLADLARADPQGHDPWALYARFLAASARRDYGAAMDLAEIAVERSAESPDDAPWAFVAARAADALSEIAEQLPHGRERFRRWAEGLPRDRLPVTVRNELLSYKGALARIEGRPHAPIFAAQGCVQGFAATAVAGHHGVLSLDRAVPAAVREFHQGDPTAVVPLSCAVRTWNRTGRPGARALVTDLDVRTAPLRLEVAASGAHRVYLEDRLLFRTDGGDRRPPKRRTLYVDLAPGRYRLTVSLALEGAKGWLLLRAHDGAGRPVEAAVPDAPRPPRKVGGLEVRRRLPPLQAEEGRGPAVLYGRPVRWALALDHALDEGDLDRAEDLADRLRRRFSRYAEGRVLAARAADSDPNRSRAAAADRAAADLDAALSMAPELEEARQERLEIEWTHGDRRRVREALGRLPEARFGAIESLLFRFDVHHAEGDRVSARSALARAEGRFALHCGVLERKRRLARERNEVRAEDQLVAAMDRCPGALLRRAEWAFERGDAEAVAAYAEAQLARVPDDEAALGYLASAAASLPRYDLARRARERLRSLRPFDGEKLLAELDVLAQLEPAERVRSALAKALLDLPFDGALRRAARGLGIEDELAAFRGDPAPAVAAFRAAGSDDHGAAEVAVYDRAVARVYADGTVRTLVHEVRYLATKEAVDRHGELSLPGGADLWTARVRKPDGRTRLPDRVPGKSSLSFPDLSVGDLVELEYVVTRAPSPVLPGYADVAAFRFQSPDVPYAWSELVVAAPADMPVRFDTWGAVPEPQTRDEGGLRVTTFTARNVPRLGREPHMADPRYDLPVVRVYTPVRAQDVARSFAARLAGADWTTPSIRRFVRGLLSRGPKPPAAILRAVWRFVTREVEPDGELGDPAARTFFARRGHHANLLRALLRDAGVPTELWLARPRFAVPARKGGWPMLDEYVVPVVMAYVGAPIGPVPILPGQRDLPPGYLPPALSGALALRIPPSGGRAGPAFARLPQTPGVLRDRRVYDLELTWTREGGGRLSGRILLSGQEAAHWRAALRAVDPSRRRELFTAVELARFPHGFTLASLAFSGEQDPFAPLEIRFAAHTDRLGVAQGGGRTLAAGFVEANPARSFAGLRARRTHLLVPYAPSVKVRLRLRAEAGKIARLPPQVRIETRAGAYVRRVRRDEGGAAALEVESRVRPGVYPPGAYPEVRRLAEEVAAAEAATVRYVPAGGPGEGRAPARGL